MIFANVSNGWAPAMNRPLIKMPGVPCDTEFVRLRDVGVDLLLLVGIQQIGFETFMIELQILRMLLQVVRPKFLLVCEQRVVELPELALFPRGFRRQRGADRVFVDRRAADASRRFARCPGKCLRPA